MLAALAGHRSIATTQRYIELNENVLRAAVELALKPLLPVLSY